MAPRPYWKGYLKLSLVTCPVALTPATSEGEKLRFHTLNAATGNRVRSRYIDAETNKPVADDDQVKGYETGEGQHVVIEDEEAQAVALESTRTIDIDRFAPAESIDWVWYDTPYYLAPDDEVGQEAFAVIREAMAATGTVGISRLVLSRRERAVLLQPRGKGIVLWTLRYGDEVRAPEEVFDKVKEAKVDGKLLTLVQKLIDDQTQSWDPKLMQDPVQKSLQDIIAAKAKKKGRKPAAKTKAEPEQPETPTNVVSIMDALKKSLSKEKAKG